MPRKASDLLGKRFGMLTVLGRAAPKPYTLEAIWLCRCDCGNTTSVAGGSLKRGDTKSCGCSKGRFVSEALKSSDPNRNRLRSIWRGMIERCENTKSTSYSLYGARGIGVCDEWKSFDSFMAWALSNGYADGLTLDRINGNDGYSPDNCRWVTWQVQQNNRCNNHIISIDGESDTLTNWARRFNIPWWVVSSRIRNGWDEERAVKTPKRYYPCRN